MLERRQRTDPRTLQDLREWFREGAKLRLVNYILSHPPGTVFTSGELERVAGGPIQWQRRLRDLRAWGVALLSHQDRHELGPDEYRIDTFDLGPRVQKRGIKASTRMHVLARQPYCGLCGRAAGDPHPDTPGRTVRLEVDHIDPDGPDDEQNLWVLCQVCNNARRNHIPVDTDWINGTPLLRQLRSAPQGVKSQALEFLLDYFGENRGG